MRVRKDVIWIEICQLEERRVTTVTWKYVYTVRCHSAVEWSAANCVRPILSYPEKKPYISDSGNFSLSFFAFFHSLLSVLPFFAFFQNFKNQLLAKAILPFGPSRCTHVYTYWRIKTWTSRSHHFVTLEDCSLRTVWIALGSTALAAFLIATFAFSCFALSCPLDADRKVTRY